MPGNRPFPGASQERVNLGVVQLPLLGEDRYLWMVIQAPAFVGIVIGECVPQQPRR